MGGLSADGRFVVLTSTAADLLPGNRDRNNAADVFLADRATGALTLVSRSAASPQISPVISADGRFVAFLSSGYDLLLWDRTTGVSRLVSHQAGSPTTPTDESVTLGGISADGRFLVFTSQAGNLVAGQVDSASSVDIFLYDRDTDQSVVVSRAGGPARTAARGGFSPKLSADGRFVAFLSTSADLLPGATGILPPNVFRFDRQTGAVTLASRALSGPGDPANRSCQDLSISADGAVIAFSNAADNLAPRDFNRNAEGPLLDAFAAVLP